MNNPLYLEPQYRTANEPKVHSLIKKSFAFVSSAGMRLAPEILVLELMREVFFESHFNPQESETRDLDPEERSEGQYFYPAKERAVLYALRGRRKKSQNSMTQRFFAPAYPHLARQGWLGKNRERVIYNFLFSGPMAQHLWKRGQDSEEAKKEQIEISERVWQALLGKNSCFDQDPKEKEILAATLGKDCFNADRELPFRNLAEKTKCSDTVMKVENDDLASRITHDLLAICGVEARVPRMQWLQLLMTFLRFALPMWLLAQMQITMLLHSWLLNAMDNEHVIELEKVLQDLNSRNRKLLHPTLTPTRELFDHIERYIKCRVEINILLYCLEQARPNQLDKKRLSLSGGSKDELPIEKLLIVARDASNEMRNSDYFKSVAENLNVKTFLTREGERFSAWRNPLMRGQGKNIDEFFRVLYHAEIGDEAGGYLLSPEGRGARRGFLVFPGQLLLKTATYLAAQSKWRGGVGQGKLVLQDVEEHFSQYGIDFSTAADARPLLMEELRAMGLLTGSPDAGSSVAVACPYS